MVLRRELPHDRLMRQAVEEFAKALPVVGPFALDPRDDPFDSRRRSIQLRSSQPMTPELPLIQRADIKCEQLILPRH